MGCANNIKSRSSISKARQWSNYINFFNILLLQWWESVSAWTFFWPIHSPSAPDRFYTYTGVALKAGKFAESQSSILERNVFLCVCRFFVIISRVCVLWGVQSHYREWFRRIWIEKQGCRSIIRQLNAASLLVCVMTNSPPPTFPPK